MPEQNDNKPENGRRRKKNANLTRPADGDAAAAERAADAKEGAQNMQKGPGRGRKPAQTPNEPAGGNKQSNGSAPHSEKEDVAAAQPRKRGRPKKSAASGGENNGNNKKEAAPAGKQEAKRPSGGHRRPRPAMEKAAAHGTEIKTANQIATAMAEPSQPAPVKTANRRRGRKPAGAPKVRIIPLGGLGEVGKNVTVYECQGDAFLVDCGMTFPDESMPGVDLVLPDFTYILENRDHIRGIVVTHGHEDHIGAIPYLLKQFNLPIYATKLTCGLIENKLKEHGLLGKVTLNVMKPGDVVKLGCMSVEFINVNHSIPDACAFAIQTPAGIIVHTGDYKIDFTPIGGEVINLARFGELGSQGVLALLSDSTNAERPGSTPSERTVGESFDKIFAGAAGKRILVATFSSNVYRVQQIIAAAVKYGRKVAVSGRSMENVVNKSLEIGYLDVPSGVLVDIDAIGKYPKEKMVIITTGSQGEPMSALTRMAMGDHRKVTITENDCIIISATPIPGNEKLVTKVINELMKLGAEVVYERMYDIHVSGHACQDELKMMISLTKPKFFVPAHGEFKHLKKHASLAVSMGIAPQNVLIGDIGKVIETNGDTMQFSGNVTAGKVLVDGLGVGDVGSVVLRDRKHLAQDGLIVVVTTIESSSGRIIAGPDIVSRGFVYVKESEDMMAKTRNIARDCIRKCMENNTREWGVIKQRIRDDVGDYLWQRTKRSPMILPVVQEVHGK